MPGERLSMRKIREVLRLRLGHGLTAARCRAEPAAEPGCGQRLSEPGTPGRAGLAVAGRAR